MNKIFKVKWSNALQTHVVCSELSKANDCSSSSQSNSIKIATKNPHRLFALSVLALTGVSMDNAIAYTENNDSTGSTAIAIGSSSTTPASATEKSVAIGANAKAWNMNSGGMARGAVAIGRNAETTVSGAIAIGDGAYTHGDGAITLGLNANATGVGAMAIGRNAYTLDGIAVGGLSSSTGLYSAAFGRGANASGPSATAIGRETNASGFYAVALGWAANASNNSATALGDHSTASGSLSTAVGYNTKATGSDSIALGRDSKALGASSNAQGYFAEATAGSATAISTRASATGQSSTAIGSYATATGVQANAIGTRANSSGTSSFAIGSGSISSGSSSFAVGSTSKASAEGAMALGSNANASAWAAHSEGTNSAATQQSAYAMGTGANASGHSSYSIGRDAITLATSAYAIGQAANASAGNAIAIGTTAKSSGASAFALGVSSNSTGTNSYSLGVRSSATGTNSQAFGSSANASNTRSVAIGTQALSSADSSMAIGYKANAIAANSIAMGSSANASLMNAVALGVSSNAIGANAYALGLRSSASGTDSQAFGSSANASNTRSVAIGTRALSSADSSTAIGYQANAIAANSIAMGSNANASLANSVALGSNAITTDTLTVYSAGTTAYSTATVVNTTYGNFAGANPTSVISVGKVGQERRIQNVAAGLITATSTDAINGSQLYSIMNTGWKAQANGTQFSNVQLGDTVNYVSQDRTVILTPTSEVNGVSKLDFAVNIDGSSIVRNANGTLSAVLPPTATIQTTNLIVSNNQVNTPVAADTTKLVTAQNVAETINKVGFTLTTSASANGSTTGSSNELINAGKTVTIDAGKNIQVTQTGSKVSLATKDDVNFNSITVGNVTINANTGIHAGNNKITGVADGDITPTSKDAVNGSQLYALKQIVINNTNNAGTRESVTAGSNAVTVTPTTTNNVNNFEVDLSQSTKNDIQKGVDAKDIVDRKGLTFVGDTGATNVQKLGSTVNVIGDNNIKTTASGNQVQVKLKKDIQVNSVKAQTVTANTVKASTVNANTVNANSLQVGNVKINQQGINAGGQRITNVKAGVKPTDAVNVSQLRSETQHIHNRIDNVDKDLRAGIAGALASGNLYHATQPGESMIAAGVGNYKGESGFAVGYSRISDNGKIGIKFSVNSNTKGDTGTAASVGYKW